MYHRFVKSKVHSTFAQITAGNWEPMVKAMAPRFSYHFYGDSALSGERHTTEAVRRWWERSFRLIPSATFGVLDIVVSGSPWNTSIATAVAVHATLADGSSYENVFNQFMHMKWGRVTEIRTLENTEVLQRAMDRLAAGGYEEAHAVPITDEPATWPSHNFWSPVLGGSWPSTPSGCPAGARGGLRLRPDRVLADKAYSSRTIRAWLRRHGIRCEVVSVQHATD